MGTPIIAVRRAISRVPLRSYAERNSHFKLYPPAAAVSFVIIFKGLSPGDFREGELKRSWG